MVQPDEAALPIEALAALMRPPVRGFVGAVLSAPVTQGTLRKLAVVAALPGVDHMWGKTGTGDAADGRRTRVVWQVGGLLYRGRPLSFLVMAAGGNRHPLGRIESGAITPLTGLLLRTALHLSGDGR
nr:hypothetical protein [uncultured Rhodopila sp.]